MEHPNKIFVAFRNGMVNPAFRGPLQFQTRGRLSGAGDAGLQTKGCGVPEVGKTNRELDTEISEIDSSPKLRSESIDHVQPFSELSTENTESESPPCRRSRLYTLEVFRASSKERMLAVVAVLTSNFNTSSGMDMVIRPDEQREHRGLDCAQDVIEKIVSWLRPGAIRITAGPMGFSVRNWFPSFF
jgi:hypothetical protein